MLLEAPPYWRSNRNSHSASHLWVSSRDVATDSVVKIASGRSNTKWFLLWMYAHMLAQIILGDKVSLALNALVIAIATDTLNMQFLLLLLLIISNGTYSPMYERGSISQEISCIKDESQKENEWRRCTNEIRPLNMQRHSPTPHAGGKYDLMTCMHSDLPALVSCLSWCYTLFVHPVFTLFCSLCLRPAFLRQNVLLSWFFMLSFSLHFFSLSSLCNICTVITREALLFWDLIDEATLSPISRIDKRVASDVGLLFMSTGWSTGFPW